MKRLFGKCLFEADKRGVTSIAMPVIGTGTLQLPKDIVAKVAFDQAVSFSGNNPRSSIKEVTYVVYDQDQSTVHAFKREIQKWLPQHGSLTRIPKVMSRPRHVRNGSSPSDRTPMASALPSLKERGADSFEMNLGNLCVQVQKGNIIDEATDAIVAVSNSNLDLSSTGEVGAAILRKGGLPFKIECNQRGPQQPGTVVSMTAGNLRTSNLFHMIPVDLSQANVKNSILQCFRKADSLNLTSMSFPAIGTGAIGFSARDCAEIMLSAADEYSKENPRNLGLVRIIIYQQVMLKDFLSVMKAMAGIREEEHPGIMKRIVNWVVGRKEIPPAFKTFDIEEAQSKVKLQVSEYFYCYERYLNYYLRSHTLYKERKCWHWNTIKFMVYCLMLVNQNNRDKNMNNCLF